MDENLNDSILETVKHMLGSDTDDHFDSDIIVLINSAFDTLHQLGFGPKKGFTISDSSTTWADYSDDIVGLQLVKNYIYLKVKVIFDPPSSSYVLESYNKSIAELEWRINVQAESSETTDSNTEQDTYRHYVSGNVLVLEPSSSEETN
jgi:hypothetical protein